MKKSIKFVVTGIIIKRVDGDWKILTCIRVVQNKAYDPLYDQTNEVMSETMKNPEEGEDVEDVPSALNRGIKEEYGVGMDNVIQVMGQDLKPVDIRVYDGGKGDKYLSLEPFHFTQSLAEPQPWITVFFVVEVTPDFEVNHELKDGEAGASRWWNLKELGEALEANPAAFMGLHVQALRKAIDQLSHNELLNVAAS
jgi:hypothetical protein